MFVKNSWYCAGWDYELSQGKEALLTRRIAGEELVLYRKPNGGVVAMEDRCCHRQSPLSLGRKEGDALRCMYHGLKFGPDGKCVEIPGQENIPPQACVRTFPVVEKDNWIWVWMGDPEKADPELICFSIGPGDKNWNIKTSKVHVNANYRLEIANLMDLSHVTWVHEHTFGGTDAYTYADAKHTLTKRGVNSKFWLRGVPAPFFADHLFPQGALFDLRFDVEMTIPCNFILHFQVWSPGSATDDGEPTGEMILDSYACQAITPRDEDSVDYYYSWGSSVATDGPGISDMLHETITTAFIEDKDMLEAQHQRMKERPNKRMIDIVHDAGPAKLLWVLDKLLKEEASEATQALELAAS